MEVTPQKRAASTANIRTQLLATGADSPAPDNILPEVDANDPRVDHGTTTPTGPENDNP